MMMWGSIYSICTCISIFNPVRISLKVVCSSWHAFWNSWWLEVFQLSFQMNLNMFVIT